jgi:hypothetical protein
MELIIKVEAGNVKDYTKGKEGYHKKGRNLLSYFIYGLDPRFK